MGIDWRMMRIQKKANLGEEKGKGGWSKIRGERLIEIGRLILTLSFVLDLDHRPRDLLLSASCKFLSLFSQFDPSPRIETTHTLNSSKIYD